MQVMVSVSFAILFEVEVVTEETRTTDFFEWGIVVRGEVSCHLAVRVSWCHFTYFANSLESLRTVIAPKALQCSSMTNCDNSIVPGVYNTGSMRECFRPWDLGGCYRVITHAGSVLALCTSIVWRKLFIRIVIVRPGRCYYCRGGGTRFRLNTYIVRLTPLRLCAKTWRSN